MINEANLVLAPWERRLGLLAHQLAHSLQYELGGGHRGTSDQWLREGFAEWVSVRVLERLQTTSVEYARRKARLALGAALLEQHIQRCQRGGAMHYLTRERCRPRMGTTLPSWYRDAWLRSYSRCSWKRQ